MALRDLFGRGVVFYFTTWIAVLTPARFGFDQRKAASERAVFDRFIFSQIVRYCAGLCIKRFGGKPGTARSAHEVPIAGTPDPVPALLRYQPKPGAAKSCIGHNNRRASRVWQQRFDAFHELAMHPLRAQMFARMHFLVERASRPSTTIDARNQCHCISALKLDQSMTINSCGKPLSHVRANAA